MRLELWFYQGIQKQSSGVSANYLVSEKYRGNKFTVSNIEELDVDEKSQLNNSSSEWASKLIQSKQQYDNTEQILREEKKR